MAEKLPPAPSPAKLRTATLPETEQTKQSSAENLVATLERELDALPYSENPTSKYQKKLAELNEAKASVERAKSAVGKKKAVSAKKRISELEIERKRLRDKGVADTDSRVKNIDDEINALKGQAAVAAPEVPSAIKPKAGVMPPKTAAATSGVPDTLGPTDGMPAAPTPPSPGRVNNTTVDKTAWVSWMRQTFKTLEDVNERKIINDLLAEAKKQNWTEQQFLDALDQKSAWWRNELPSLQQFFLDSNDPRKAGQFQQQVNNKVTAIETTLEKLGVNLNRVDPITGKVMTADQYTEAVKGVALEAMKNGWGQSDIENYLATKVDVVFSGGGTIGTAISNVKRWGDYYGIPIDDNYAKTINASLLDPNDGRDVQWWYNEMQRQSAENYAPFASGLSQGRTLQDMTQNYRTTMAKLLEVDPNEISWKDLMGYAVKTDDKGNQTKATMAEFVKGVKNDPMWQYTRNAKETYTTAAMDLLKDFGIVG